MNSDIKSTTAILSDNELHEQGHFSQAERDAVYRAVYSRRDVRSQFKPDPIPNAVLVRILNAAHHAPSVGFSQPWNFILIMDPETRRRIHLSFERERERSSRLLDEASRSEYLKLKLEGIREAPVNLCVTYDPRRFGPFVLGRTAIPETGIYSVCCAIQNLWLAARVEGLGVGWVSILSNSDLKEILEIPGHVTPIAYLCIGYVTHFEPKPDLERLGWLPRLPLASVVNFERWNRKETDANWHTLKDKLTSMV